MATPPLPGDTAARATLVSRLLDPERLQQYLALAIRIASAGLGYAILAGSARITDISDFSDFALVMAATGMFGAIATLGQETLLLRRLPIVVADGLAGYRYQLGRSARIVGPSLLLFALIAIAYGYHSFTSRSPVLLVLIGFLVAGSGAAELLFAVQRGSGSVLGAVFRRELVWKLLLAAAIATFFLLHRKVGVVTLAGWYLIGTVAAVASSLVFVATIWRRAPAGSRPSKGTRDNAFAFFLLNFIAQAGTQIDILVLGMMTAVPPVELGAFFAAQRTIQVLYILPYGASITSAPRIPLAWARGDTAEIVRLSRQISREVAGVVLVLAVLAFFFRTQVMSFFRPEFAPFALVLPILALAPLSSALGGLHNMIAPMCGQETAYSRWRLGLIVGFMVVKVAAASTGSLMLLAAIGATEQIVTAAMGVVMARRKLGVWIV